MSLIRDALESVAARKGLIEAFVWEDDLDSLLVWRVLELDGDQISIIDYDQNGYVREEAWEPISDLVRVVTDSEYLARMEKLIADPNESLGRATADPDAVAEWLRQAAETGEIMKITGPGEEIMVQVHRVTEDEFAFSEIDENTGKAFEGRFAQRISLVQGVRAGDYECRLWNQ